MVETKLLECTRQKINSLWGNCPVEYLAANALGNSSGGVLVTWNPELFSSCNNYIGERWIIVEGFIKPCNWRCVVAIVYGGHTVVKQNQIYSEISQARYIVTSPFLILGDFNQVQVLQISDRRVMTQENKGMRDFKSWLESLYFFEVPLTGRKLTW